MSKFYIDIKIILEFFKRRKKFLYGLIEIV